MEYQLIFFIINSIGLGVGLAMDAFSVSLANGLREPLMRFRRMFGIAGVYAGFQFLMPLIGWFLVHAAADTFTFIRPFIPWTALILLLLIGGKMVLEGISDARDAAAEKASGENNAQKKRPVDNGTHKSKTLPLHILLGQGIATSIDALSVGLTIVEYQLLSALAASAIIGLITLVICLFGLHLGRAFGTRLAHRASILGGLILIAIGIEIFVKGLLGI